jgi:serine protease Do
MAETSERRPLTGIQEAKRATVGVLQPGEEAQRQGGKSHFVMRGTALHLRDGYLLTARHVAEQDESGRRALTKQITILTADLDEVSATLVGVNAFLDLAVYRLPDEMSGRLPTLPVASSDPDPGDEAFTIGYPLGWGPTIAFGRIGNPNTFLPTVDTRLFQIDLSVCAGNSGGGLFNTKGELIGIMHAMIQTTSDRREQPCSPLAFASPGTLVHRVASALINGEQPGFSKLGTALTAVRIGTRWQMAVSEANGPAREGGVQKGDVLLAIDTTEIADGAQLKNYLVERTIPGQRVAVRVLREGKEHVLHVTLGKS